MLIMSIWLWVKSACGTVSEKLFQDFISYCETSEQENLYTYVLWKHNITET